MEACICSAVKSRINEFLFNELLKSNSAWTWNKSQEDPFTEVKKHAACSSCLYIL